MSRKLIVALRKAKEANEMLRNEYVRLGDECYRKDDFKGRDYWNERFFELGCENEKIDMDIRKIKEEMTHNDQTIL